MPKIRTRTLPHPEIDKETKNLMEEASRLKALLSSHINYMQNRRKLFDLQEITRERWKRWNMEKWRRIVERIDLKKDSGDFWWEVNRCWAEVSNIQ